MKWKPNRDALSRGYRSGLELRIADNLIERGQAFSYEPGKIPFTQPAKARRYTPDFILPNGIVVEAKGRFLTADRQKFVMIAKSHPGLDIRFAFSNPKQRISKQSQTTYSAWAEYKGFLWCGPEIPDAWLNAKPRRASLKILKELGLL